MPSPSLSRQIRRRVFRRAVVVLATLTFSSAGALLACGATTGTQAATSDAEVTDASRGAEVGQSTDRDTSAGPKCGYAGEPCCTAPRDPCTTGLGCSTASSCVANDVWAVGSYLDVNNRVQGVSAHYDGTGWTEGPPLGTNGTPLAAWGLEPGNYRAVTDTGTILHLSTSTWLVSGMVPRGGPITGFEKDDFWISVGGTSGGTSAVYRCTDATCKSAGLPDGWGQGRGSFAGTSSNDLWYASGGAYHWDGNAWADSALGADTQLSVMWACAPNDVWAAGPENGNRLFHYDGTKWSTYAIDGIANISIEAIAGSATDDVWAAGRWATSDNRVLSARAHYDGAHWTAATIRPEEAPRNLSLWVVSKTEAFALWASGDGVDRWDGTSWSAMTLPMFTVQFPVEGGVGSRGAKWNAVTGSARSRP